jgi:hypothetical protein
VGRVGVHVIVFVAVGRTAHHAQHSDPAGAGEPGDQGGGEVIDTATFRTLLQGT